MPILSRHVARPRLPRWRRARPGPAGGPGGTRRPARAAAAGRRLALRETLALDRDAGSLLSCAATGATLLLLTGGGDRPGRRLAARRRGRSRERRRTTRPAAGLAPLLAGARCCRATAHAQSVSIDLGAAGQAGATSRLVQLTALITVLSLAPSLLVMVHRVHPHRHRAVAAAQRPRRPGHAAEHGADRACRCS